MSRDEDSASILIIGGGLAGLAAADRIKQYAMKNPKGPNITCCVAEAHPEHFGGRVRTDYSDSGKERGTTELGAAFFGPGQDRMLRLIKRFNLNLEPVYTTDGDGTMMMRKYPPSTALPSSKTSASETAAASYSHYKFDGFLPQSPWYAVLDANNALKRFEEVMMTIPCDEPHLAPNARFLDTISLDDYLRKHLCWTYKGYQYLKFNFRTLLTTEIHSVSALAALWFMRAAGGVKKIFEGETWKLKEGNSAIVAALAESFSNEDEWSSKWLGTVQLGSPVRKVGEQWLDGRLYFAVQFGTPPTRYYQRQETETRLFTHIIFAIPPNQILKIEFGPKPLPGPMVQEILQMPMGNVIKTFCYFPEAFWHGRRKTEEQGQCVTDRQTNCQFNGRAFADGDLGWLGNDNNGHGVVANDIFDVTHRSQRRLTIVVSEDAAQGKKEVTEEGKSNSNKGGRVQVVESEQDADDDKRSANRKNGANAPCLLGFIGAQDASYWSNKTAEERKLALEQQYRRVFEQTKHSFPSEKEFLDATKVVHYKESMWSSEPWVGGCYFALARIGTLTTFKRQWRKSRYSFDEDEEKIKKTNRIFFAGTETSDVWMGYMEGAVASGERAADELLNNAFGHAQSLFASSASSTLSHRRPVQEAATMDGDGFVAKSLTLSSLASDPALRGALLTGLALSLSAVALTGTAGALLARHIRHR